MDIPTAYKTIDFLNGSEGDRITITFFGGEPLLLMDLMENIIDYAWSKYPSKFAFRASTNGVLINQCFLELCRKYNMSFVLSLDGNSEMQNANRITPTGKGSFALVEKNIDAILGFNPYTIVVSVITPETATLVYDSVTWLFDRGFKYVVQTLDHNADWNKNDLVTLAKQYKQLSRFYFNALEEGKKIYYSPFDERIKTRTIKPLQCGDLCDLANTQIAVAPSGRLYPCVQFIGNDTSEHQKFSIGDVFTGFNQEKRLNYVKENYGPKKPCDDCELNGRCMNGCGCVNWRATGKLNLVPVVLCEHERMLMPIVDKLANKLWKKNNELFKRKFYSPFFALSSYIEDCAIKSKGR